MSTRLLFISFLILALGWGQPRLAAAQKPYWYTVQNGVIVLKTGSTYKLLKDDVTLPNGNRLQPLTRNVVLPSGEQIQLNQDDMVTPSGDVIRMKAPATAAASSPAAAAAPAAPATSSSFAYAPPALVNGKLKGVVELGASGFNSFIVRIDAKRNWKLEKAEFGNSLVLENMATEDDIRRGLKAYIGKMLDFGVDGRSIYFVVSSGAATAAVTQHIVQSLKSLGYVVHTVTPEEEGRLGLRAAVPTPYADQAFMVDMGSANTKLAWLDHGTPTVLNSFGSKYYQQATDDATVAADIKAKASQVPAGHRQTCFIIGGVPFELAKAARQGKEPYTVLSPPAGYAQLEGAKLKAGLTIYQALAAATGCQQFVFGWDTNFTIGYLLQTP